MLVVWCGFYRLVTDVCIAFHHSVQEFLFLYVFYPQARCHELAPSVVVFRQIVMEYMNAGTVSGLLRDFGPFPMDVLGVLMKQVS